MEETVYKREFVEGLADVQEDIRLYIRSVLLNCQDSVDDVVQETNLALLRHAPEYDTSKPFRPWAFGFAKQQVLVFRRKQKADRLVLGEEAVNRIAEAYTEVPRQTEKSLPIFRRLAICKKRLSDGERTLLDLRYGDNLTPREIAERRNLTSRKIRNELMCIRRRLSDCIHRLCRMSEGTLDKEGEAIDSFDKELSELMDSSFFPRQVRKVLGMADASPELCQRYAEAMQVHLLLSDDYGTPKSCARQWRTSPVTIAALAATLLSLVTGSAVLFTREERPMQNFTPQAAENRPVQRALAAPRDLTRTGNLGVSVASNTETFVTSTEKQQKSREGDEMKTSKVITWAASVVAAASMRETANAAEEDGQQASALAICATNDTADVFGDAVAWWRFDKDFNGDCLVQTNEIRDVRHWGSTNLDGGPTGGYRVGRTFGPYGAPLWTNMDVTMNWGGYTVTNARCIYFPIVTNTECKAYSSGMVVNGLAIPGTSSLFARIYTQPLFASRYSNYGYLFNNALSWGKNTGWEFGLVAKNIEGTAVCPVLVAGNGIILFQQFTMYTNTWYDIGLSLTDNGDNDIAVVVVASSTGMQVVTNTIGAHISDTLNTTYSIFANETIPLGYGPYTNNNNYAKAFNGAVHELAVWKRALSVDDFKRVFSYPLPLFAVGSEDGGNGEFGLSNEVSYTNNVFAPWHEMPGSLDAGHTPITLQFVATASETGIASLFHFKSAETGETGQRAVLGLKINNNAFDAHSVGMGEDIWWFVPSNTLFKGTNTIQLSYKGGTASSVGLDKIEMTGSWQVGYDDRNHSEFSAETSSLRQFHVGDRNLKHMSRSIMGFNIYSNILIHFYLPQRVAERYSFFYQTRILLQDGTSGATNSLFGIAVNDVPRYASPTNISNSACISVPIPKGVLHRGWNSIRVYTSNKNDKSYYYIFDFHRLQLKDYPHGTVIMLR